MQAQWTIRDVFKHDVPITWLGVDFSQMKFIGPASSWGNESTKSSAEIRDTYFRAWNETIEKEAHLFKIEEAVDRKTIGWGTDVSRRANEQAGNKEIFSEETDDYQSLREDYLAELVRHYRFNGLSGIGFILIAEGMNKNLAEASYWATFIDMQEGRILFAKRIIGSAGGFGFRNYWLGSIKSVFRTMKKEFKTWK